MNQPTVEISAIIISYNGMQFLPDCLSTLVDDLNGLDNEIIVVDNGSEDASIEFIKREYPGVRIIENGSNLGFARAVNIGLKEAHGRYLYILNQDLRFGKGTASSLLERLKTDRQIGLIGPKFVGFDGQLQRSARAFPSYRHVFYRALFLDRLFPRHREFAGWRMGWFDHKTEMSVDQPMGAVMLIPCEVVDRVGYLDENFPILFNDVDYCRRIKQAGYTLLYYPNAVVEHFVGGSTRKRPVSLRITSHVALYRYLKKYARPIEYPLLWLSGLCLGIGLMPLLISAAIKQYRQSEPT